MSLPGRAPVLRSFLDHRYMALIKLEIYNFPRLRFFGGEMPLDRALFYNQMAKRSKAIQIAKHWVWQGERR
jgi:hypothetical protein